ncbi:hypothetical protein ACFC1R_34090 [Kitasatospora sp. NPDC056138]|uniref:hypothetical protein n=1 Tax=Kitasatospora sp. NPDC056138 TaxID=3345724 RepID=UPI0035DFC109
MNVDDLQWQVGTLGGVLPRLVDEIRDRGGLEALVQAAREREDWFCAAGAVRELCAAGEFGRAWAVVEPFAATRWQPAVRVGADVLVRWGRVDQALELARPEGPQENAVDASRDYAVVLVRAGRVEEAIRLLGADVAARRYGPQNNVGSYAELLARHGRIEELRELADAQRYSAVVPYVRALENAGQAGEAETYLRDLIAAGNPGWHENTLMELLIRQGRFDDAIKAVEHTFDDLYDGNLLQRALILLADQGQHGKAIGLTEGRSPEFLAENEAYWLRSNRWWLMGESGRAREAIAEVEALPADEVDDRELTIAWLLAQDARVEEAIALLRSLPGKRAATDLAELLIRQDRFTEAIAAIPDVTAQREEARHLRTNGQQALSPGANHIGDAPSAAPNTAPQE